MIRSPLARILAIAFVVLSFSMLVWGAPVEAGKNLLARGGTCSVGCTTGTSRPHLSLPRDLSGLLNGKIVVIVNLCVSIVIDIASHCGKWSDKPNFDVFLGLIVVIDVALKGLLSACGGLLGTILGLIAGLLGGANLALLLKVKFNLCVGILGL
ncbi:hypothetical protein RHS01_02895 [Rhizoctonia solani]|uniref:Hydrophobin n=1 Tax=Rhizoctonia solani TaxID=456999 RepID=A0A8H7IHY2_9AGAM|nr:hypothetical protein RHS01_02895 [Rhizoctonia solani]